MSPLHCRIWPFPLIWAGGSSSSLDQIQCLQDIYSWTWPEIQGWEGATQDVRVLLCKYCCGRMSLWRRQQPSKVCRSAQWKSDVRGLLHANTVWYHSTLYHNVSVFINQKKKIVWQNAVRKLNLILILLVFEAQVLTDFIIFGRDSGRHSSLSVTRSIF